MQQTADGRVIVMHDSNLRRTCGVDANVWELDYEQVSRLDAGSWFGDEFSGERVPLLSEVLGFARKAGLRLNIEIKPTGHETDIVGAVMDLVDEAGMTDRCAIASLRYSVLEDVKARDPSMRTVYVMGLAYGGITRLDAADAYSVEETSVTETLVGTVHNDGRELLAWTVDDEGHMDALIERGVDNIITDDVTLARERVDGGRYDGVLAGLADLLG